MRKKNSYIFETVPYGSSFVLYGAGKYGLKIWRQNQESNWAKIVTTVDRNYRDIIDFPMKVESVESLSIRKDYDYIVIAIKNKEIRLEVINTLLELGIDENIIREIKISDYYIPERLDSSIGYEIKGNGTIRIGIYLEIAGLGDQIISKKVYQELVKEFPESSIDIYSLRGAFSHTIYEGEEHLNSIIESVPGSEEWEQYDLFIELSMQLLVRHINRKKLTISHSDFESKVMKHIEYQKRRYVDLPNRTYSDLVMIGRARVLGLNRYTLFGESGLFEIKDKNVEIGLKQENEKKYEQLRLRKQYFTFNYGADSVKAGGTPQIKMWPQKYFEILLKQIKNEYPYIEIIQIGASNCEKIIGADKYVLGESLELIKYILINSLFHFDCEGGLMHLASQLGTKCVVVYGPTPCWFLGYESNINILPTVCGECMGLTKNTWFECYRNDIPDCMLSIKPEIVMHEIRELLDQKNEYEGDENCD